MSLDDINALAQQPRGGRWIKLRNAGDKITGELLSIEEMNRTDPSGEIVLSRKNNPRKIWRVRIQTEQNDDVDDDGIRIFDANEAAQQAIKECIRRDGALTVGGTIAIAVTADPPSAMSQATYVAKFKAGKPKPAAVNVDDLI